ncbi:MAG TPA: serine hydrolase [Candidatus Limnocylindria bacterium]
MLLPRRIGAFIALGVVAIAGACGPPSATQAATARPSATDATQGFGAAVATIARGFDGKTGIFIAFPGVAQPIYASGADTPFIAASLYKLGVLLRVESLVNSGALSYDDTITIEDQDVTVDGSNEYPGTVLTIDQALEEMITYSDNGAALALLRVYGAHAANAALAAAGIAGFHVAENEAEDHVVTARALGTFFDLLATRRLLSSAASERMLARLERQTINDRLPRDLPDDVAVAHKTGDLVGLVHDAGLIGTPSGPRIAVVLTSGGTEADAKDLIARIGADVYSAVLPRPAGADSAALPSAQTAWARLGTITAVLLPIAAIAVLALAALAAARRTMPRKVRRAAGPMTVWSPDRARRR